MILVLIRRVAESEVHNTQTWPVGYLFLCEILRSWHTPGEERYGQSPSSVPEVWVRVNVSTRASGEDAVEVVMVPRNVVHLGTTRKVGSVDLVWRYRGYVELYWLLSCRWPRN